MKHYVIGIFKNSKHAGMAVSELKEKGYTDDISVVAKEWEGTEVTSHTVKDTDAGVGGAITGAVVGGLAGLLIGVTTLAIPGIGAVLIAGPLAALLGATGALTGGLIGALAQIGISEDKARLYEDAVRRGEVLVAVAADHEYEDDVRNIFNKHGVNTTDTQHHSFASS